MGLGAGKEAVVWSRCVSTVAAAQMRYKRDVRKPGILMNIMAMLLSDHWTQVTLMHWAFNAVLGCVRLKENW